MRVPDAPLVDPRSPAGRLLREHRDVLNAALLRAAATGGTASLLLAALADVAPVLAALPVRDEGGDAGGGRGTGPSDRTAPRAEVVAAVAAASLAVAARGRWGAGTPAEWALREVVPLLGGWLDAWPEEVVGLVLAAARPVAVGGDGAAWAGLLAAAAVAAPEADLGEVRGALLLATWRCGLPRYRDAALAVAPTLPVPLAAAALGLAPGELARALAGQAADRWSWPGRRAHEPGVLCRVGGFRGLGGSWLELPRVACGTDDGWQVVADGARWVVVADVHGSAVVHATASPGAGLPDTGAAPGGPAWRGPLPVPWHDEVTGSALDPSGRVVAVSRRHSYLVDLVHLGAA